MLSNTRTSLFSLYRIPFYSGLRVNLFHSFSMLGFFFVKNKTNFKFFNILFVCLLVKGKNINNVFWYVSFISMIMTLYTPWKVICTNIYNDKKCNGNLHHIFWFLFMECSIIKKKNISKFKCKNRDSKFNEDIYA